MHNHYRALVRIERECATDWYDHVFHIQPCLNAGVRSSRALKSGARIIAARRDDVPGKGVIAAILRYPI